ncbi:MAG: PGPGW domain-containing protein [Melioribacter sp.]|nr:PGPGW domain-containing protein [Melioribacter sp.]
MTKRKIKKLFISIIGFTLLCIGIITIIFPGPAYLIIPAGLGILGTEYLWARKLHEKIKREINIILNRLYNK